ncbi:uncharacterized protein METZ01_LOCUS329993 [marine metagenome]|uniref:Uncharacterized protein n=1 Tax=marine metagenome TaxID=408172 RepID=A0A382PUV9_9ZZZZ
MLLRDQVVIQKDYTARMAQAGG